MNNTIKFTLLSAAFCMGFLKPALADDVWVSDEIEAPLRAEAKLNAKIVSLLPAGQKVNLIKKVDGFVQIKTAEGKEGWLSSYYVLDRASVHAQLEPMKKQLTKAQSEIARLKATLTEQTNQIDALQNHKNALEKSATDVSEQAKNYATEADKANKINKILQEKLTQQSQKMEALASTLNQEKERAINARTRYLSLIKVSENLEEIDQQNRSLQKKAVSFEKEIQQLKNENQSLTAQLNTRQTMITALLIFGGVLVGYVLSILMPPRGRRASSNYSL